MKKQFTLLAVLMCCAYTQAQLTDGDKLEFTYDVSGNQMLRDIPDLAKTNNETSETIEEDITYTQNERIENAFIVAPNPTNGEVTLQWRPELSEQITSIELVSLVTSQRTAISFERGNSVSIDLSTKAAGLYLVIFHLNNNTVPSIQKKIIKM